MPALAADLSARLTQATARLADAQLRSAMGLRRAAGGGSPLMRLPDAGGAMRWLEVTDDGALVEAERQRDGQITRRGWEASVYAPGGAETIENVIEMIEATTAMGARRMAERAARAEAARQVTAAAAAAPALRIARIRTAAPAAGSVAPAPVAPATRAVRETSAAEPAQSVARPATTPLVEATRTVEAPFIGAMPARGFRRTEGGGLEGVGLPEALAFDPARPAAQVAAQGAEAAPTAPNEPFVGATPRREMPAVRLAGIVREADGGADVSPEAPTARLSERLRMRSSEMAEAGRTIAADVSPVLAAEIGRTRAALDASRSVTRKARARQPSLAERLAGWRASAVALAQDEWGGIQRDVGRGVDSVLAPLGVAIELGARAVQRGGEIAGDVVEGVEMLAERRRARAAERGEAARHERGAESAVPEIGGGVLGAVDQLRRGVGRQMDRLRAARALMAEARARHPEVTAALPAPLSEREGAMTAEEQAREAEQHGRIEQLRMARLAARRFQGEAFDLHGGARIGDAREVMQLSVSTLRASGLAPEGTDQASIVLTPAGQLRLVLLQRPESRMRDRLRGVRAEPVRLAEQAITVDMLPRLGAHDMPRLVETLQRQEMAVTAQAQRSLEAAARRDERRARATRGLVGGAVVDGPVATPLTIEEAAAQWRAARRNGAGGALSPVGTGLGPTREAERVPALRR